MNLIEKRQKVVNRLISTYNSVFYSLFEPVKLKYYRNRSEYLYQSENENPLVTVYIPTYNRAELLMSRSVPSVLSQTYKNIELLIIGDHCTDETEKYINSIGDPRVRFYNIPKRGYRYPPTAENHWLAGPVVGANKALELVRGRWIARIDDDDTWTPSHIRDLLRFAQQGNYEFVSSDYMTKRYGQESLIRGTKMRSHYYTRRKEDINDNSHSPKIGGTATWLYRSYLRFFRYNINCWRKKWNRVNDIDLSLRIYKAGVRIGYFPEVTSFSFPRPGEETVGLEAYLATKKVKEEHFRF